MEERERERERERAKEEEEKENELEKGLLGRETERDIERDKDLVRELWVECNIDQYQCAYYYYAYHLLIKSNIVILTF